MDNLKMEQLFKAIDQIAMQNLLSKADTKIMIEEAVKKVFHTKYDPDAELELIIDEDKQLFRLINHTKLVVADDEFNPDYNAIEIKLSIAQKNNPKVAVGDYVTEDVDFALYSRQIAQQIRQLFTQSIREKKKAAVYAKHKDLIGQMIEVTISSATPSYALFILDDGTTAFMPGKLRNPNIKLTPGKRTSVFVEDVLEDSKDAQIIVSNGSKDVVKRVVEAEVPEVQSHLVEIVKISRQPGVRSKVAVRSTDDNIDPVGAIIGARGSRILAITNSLENEKIDVVKYDDDLNVYIANALAPAAPVSVLPKLDSEGQVIPGHKIVVVANRQQTLAIGKKGINVRLAVELVSQRLDVISIDQAHEKGLAVDFNVGLTAEDLQKLETGERIRHQGGGQNWKQTTPGLDTSTIDDSIDTFTHEIESSLQEDDDDTRLNDFEVDDNLFSDEELKKMESDFEFDDESLDLDDEKDGDE